MRSTGSPTVHLLAPSVLHSSVGCGGTSLYRGVALACTTIGPTWCHELIYPDAPGDLAWAAPGVQVGSHTSLNNLIVSLRQHLKPGDIVGKWLNAGGPDDPWWDLAVAKVAVAAGARCYYLDPEPFVRLPHMVGRRHYLWDLLPMYAGVVLFSGGPRAVAEYADGGRVPVSHVSAGIGRLAHALSTPSPGRRPERRPGNDAPGQSCMDIDVLVTVALQSPRERRLATLLDRIAVIRPTTTMCLVGGIDAGLARHPAIRLLSQQDPVVLLDHYGRSRFTLNMVRPDFAGYSHTPAARVFEAAYAGSCLVTDHFPGLDDYLTPDLECLVDVDRLDAHLDLPEEDRRRMTARARERSRQHAEVEASRLVEILTTGRAVSRLTKSGLAVARRQLDLHGRCRDQRMAVLTQPGSWKPVIHAFEPEIVDYVGAVSDITDGGYQVAVVPAVLKAELDRVDARHGQELHTVIVAPPYDRIASVRMIWGRDWVMPGCSMDRT